MANRHITDDTIIDYDEINLPDCWRVIVKRNVLKQEGGSIGAGIMSRLGGGLGGLAGGFLGISTPVDTWLAILKSETKPHYKLLLSVLVK